MKMKKFPAILLCGAVLASAVTGCSGSGGESKATADSAASETKPVKEKVEKNTQADYQSAEGYRRDHRDLPEHLQRQNRGRQNEKERRGRKNQHLLL